MDELKRGRETLSKADQNVVGNYCCMGACKEPIVAAHLFLGQVGTVHGHDGTPLALNEAVGSLLMGGSGDNRGVLRP